MTSNRLHFLTSAVAGLYIVAEFGSELLLVSHLNWISKSRWSIGNQDIQMMRGKLATPG